MSSRYTGEGEVVVITGASAGVGRATARAFAKRGARIGLMARGLVGLEAAKKEVEEQGGEAVVLAGDIADAEYVEDAASSVEDRFGPIDIWVNNAMTTIFAPFDQITPEEFKRVNDVTYMGYVYGTMSALKRMKPRDRGSIVQVGSALAYRSIPLQSAYCGAKHAIKGFTDSLRTELIHDGSNVRISMVQMPALNTPQFSWSRTRMQRKAQPVPPIYQPEVAAKAIVWAAHNDRAELYVGAPTPLAIWGQRLVPRFMDWYMAKTAFESQQYDGAVDPDRPDYLWEPLDDHDDYGAHGDFDERAHSSSMQLWGTLNRGWIALGAAGVAGAAYGVFRMMTSEPSQDEFERRELER